MAAKSRNSTSKPARSFEQAIAEVEEVVARLEGGKLELAQSLDEYQRGVGTLKECYELLNQAERRITLLSGFDADGNPVTEPFEEQAMTTEEKQTARSARRSAQSPASPAPPARRSSQIREPLIDACESDYFDGEDSQDGLF